jgi:DNA replication protein DnaC
MAAPTAEQPTAPQRTSCSTCSDTRFVDADEKPDEGYLPRQRPCPACETPRRNRVRARKIGRPVPENWRGWSWDRLDVPAAAATTLKQWADFYVLMHEQLAEHGHDSTWAEEQEPMEGIWLTGGTGSMKTAAAAVLVQEIGRRLPDVGAGYAAFYAVDQLLGKLRATHGDDATDRIGDLHDALAAVDLLVLDDVVAPKHSEFTVSELYSLLNARYDAKFKPIIFTADATEAEVEAMFARAAGRENVGEAIMRRWRDRTLMVELPIRDLESNRPTAETLQVKITRLNYGKTPAEAA